MWTHHTLKGEGSLTAETLEKGKKYLECWKNRPAIQFFSPFSSFLTHFHFDPAEHEPTWPPQYPGLCPAPLAFIILEPSGINLSEVNFPCCWMTVTVFVWDFPSLAEITAKSSPSEEKETFHSSKAEKNKLNTGLVTADFSRSAVPRGLLPGCAL